MIHTLKQRFSLAILLIVASGAVSADEIHEAIFAKDIQRAQALLKKDQRLAEQPDTNNSGATPLCLAAELGNVSMAELLLKNGAKIDGTKPGEQTPLAAACYAKQVTMVNFLIKNKADANRTSGYYKRTPLHETAEVEHHGGGSSSGENDKAQAEAIAMILLEAGANPNVVETGSGFTPLHIAIGCNARTGVARRLLASGANPNAPNTSGQTPLHCAASVGQIGAMELMVKNGAKIDAVSKSFGTPLETALVYRNEPAARWLLQHGAIPNIGLVAALGDQTMVERFLLRNRALVNQHDHNGLTPLHWAAYSGKTAMAEFLIKNGGDVNAADSSGKTPLHLAAYHKSEGVAEVLVAHQADVNAPDNDRWTPLIFATWNGSNGGSQKIASLLVNHGADITATNRYGDTPSKYAVESHITLNRK